MLSSSLSLNLLTTLKGHLDTTWSISWHPSGRLLASSSTDKCVRLWGPTLASFSSVTPTTSSSSSSSSSSATKLHSSWEWECKCILEGGHKKTIRQVTFAPHGNALAMASFDTTISIWQKDTLASEDGVWTYEYVGTLEGHEHEVKSVSWSPDGSLLATASRDKTIWIWEVLEENDFECLSVLHDHTQDVKCVKWHPTQEILVSSSYDDTLRVWKDIEDDWTRIHLLQGHTSTVWSFDFDPKGDYLVSCSEDTSLRLWRFHSPEQIQLLQIIPHAHTQAIYSVSWHPHLPYLAVGSGDKSISIWECILEEHPPNPSFSPHLVCRFRCTTSYEINAVAWNPSLMYSSILASCDDHGDVHLWELQCLHPWSHVVLESEIKTRMDT